MRAGTPVTIDITRMVEDTFGLDRGRSVVTDPEAVPESPLSSPPVQILLDGHPCAEISLLDRGLQYGDGLFETLAIRQGQPCQWSRHLDRLSAGARRLGIPFSDASRLTEEAFRLAARLDEGVLKIILTRGQGGRGYRPPEPAHPRRILSLHASSPAVDWRAGVRVRYCRTCASLNPSLAGMKHLNRLDSVLARQEWRDSSFQEGVMCDVTGAISGGTMSNLFLWDGRTVTTPGVDQCGIAGTVRSLLFEIAPAWGIDCRESRVEPQDLENAQGLFLTNAVIGVWPVRQLADRSFSLDRLPRDFLTAVRDAAFRTG